MSELSKSPIAFLSSLSLRQIGHDSFFLIHLQIHKTLKPWTQAGFLNKRVGWAEGGGQA